MAIATKTAGGARETVRQKRERDSELLVWPDLVFVEFICAVLFTVTFVALSTVVNAPLLNRANSNITPNPSKAPWYLMNLQELLLHMDPGLAGVIVPTVALVLLAAIPYVDRNNEGQGGWFATVNSVRITVFSFVFSSLYVTACILWDDGAHVRIYRQLSVVLGFRDEGDEWTWPFFHNPFGGWPAEGFLNAVWGFAFLPNRVAARDEWTWGLPVPASLQNGAGDGSLDWPQDFENVPLPLNGTWIWSWSEPAWMPPWLKAMYPYDGHLNIPSIMAEYVMPIAAILIGATVLLLIIWKLGWMTSTRDALLALFTGFILVYLALTIIGAAFRGRGQQLRPFWKVPNLENDPGIMREVPRDYDRGGPAYVLYDPRETEAVEHA